MSPQDPGGPRRRARNRLARRTNLRDPRAEGLKSRLASLRELPEHQGHPLMGELQQLGEAHLRLLARLEKITRISDSFQSQLKEVNESLQRASRTDPLTDIPNRRAMMAHLAGEWVRSQREAAPLSLLMVDLDRFKTVNDSKGHEAGDRVLQALTAALRAYDVCARWGGEEFLVLLPGTDHAGALDVGGKLRKAAADLVVPTPHGPVTVTISVGAATADPGDTLDALLRRADEAMYDAKAQGGDRVVG